MSGLDVRLQKLAQRHTAMVGPKHMLLQTDNRGSAAQKAVVAAYRLQGDQRRLRQDFVVENVNQARHNRHFPCGPKDGGFW